jgi:hypothetical protein
VAVPVMAPGPRWERGRERGFTTTQYVTGGDELVTFVMLANVVDRYQGALRAAADEGARAGADLDAGARDCEQRGHDVLVSLLGEPRARSVQLLCRVVDGSMRASLRARLASWFPLVPDWDVALTGSAPKEIAP